MGIMDRKREATSKTAWVAFESTPLAPWSDRHTERTLRNYDAQALKWSLLVEAAGVRGVRVLGRHAEQHTHKPWFREAEAALLLAVTEALNAADPTDNQGMSPLGAHTSPTYPSDPSKWSDTKWSDRHPERDLISFARAFGKWSEVVAAASGRAIMVLGRHAKLSAHKPWFREAEAALLLAVTEALNAADRSTQRLSDQDKSTDLHPYDDPINRDSQGGVQGHPIQRRFRAWSEGVKQTQSETPDGKLQCDIQWNEGVCDDLEVKIRDMITALPNYGSASVRQDHQLRHGPNEPSFGHEDLLGLEAVFGRGRATVTRKHATPEYIHQRQMDKKKATKYADMAYQLAGNQADYDRVMSVPVAERTKYYNDIRRDRTTAIRREMTTKYADMAYQLAGKQADYDRVMAVPEAERTTEYDTIRREMTTKYADMAYQLAGQQVDYDRVMAVPVAERAAEYGRIRQEYPNHAPPPESLFGFHLKSHAHDYRSDADRIKAYGVKDASELPPRDVESLFGFLRKGHSDDYRSDVESLFGFFRKGHSDDYRSDAERIKAYGVKDASELPPRHMEWLEGGDFTSVSSVESYMAARNKAAQDREKQGGMRQREYLEAASPDAWPPAGDTSSCSDGSSCSARGLCGDGSACVSAKCNIHVTTACSNLEVTLVHKPAPESLSSSGIRTYE